MSETNPFLFVYLPLDRLHGDQFFDSSVNQRNVSAHQATIVQDPEFGHCPVLSGAPDSYLQSSPWSIDPFAPSFPSVAGSPRFTFSMVVKSDENPNPATLLDVGFGPGIQRLKIRLSRTGQTYKCTVLAPVSERRAQGMTWEFTGDLPSFDGWLPMALEWDPVGTGPGRGFGDCLLFVDGRPFVGSTAKRDGEATPALSAPACYQTFVGKSGFRGSLAHLRIYIRALSAEELQGDLNRDRLELHRFRKLQSMTLSLANAGNSHPTGASPTLDLSSNSGQKLVLKIDPRGAGGGPGIPSRAAGHIELEFRPGTLAPGSLNNVIPEPSDWSSSWKFSAVPGAAPGFVDSISIRRPVPEAGLTLVLDRLMPDARFGPHTTHVNLRFSKERAGQSEDVAGSMIQPLEIK